MKNAVIIGGSGGIGKAVTEEFVKRGCHVLFSYRSAKETAERFRDKLWDESGETVLEAAHLDTSSRESVEEFAKRAEALFQSIDTVVFCSGIVKDSSFLTMEEAVFEKVLEVNLTGCFRILKELFLLLNFKEGASIVAVSSTGGIRPNAGQANYAASKAGVIAMTEALAREYAKKKIRVNAVAPGFIHTDMVDLENRHIQKSIAEIPMGRLGKPEEVAKAVYFLASEEASYITAQTLIVDGGRL